jgi:hypothetical protein
MREILTRETYFSRGKDIPNYSFLLDVINVVVPDSLSIMAENMTMLRSRDHVA